MIFLEDILQKKLHVDAKYFLRGGLWGTLGQMAVVIGGVVTSIIFTHILTEPAYGVYRYLISLCGLISAFSLTGLGISILQATSNNKQIYNDSIKIGFTYSLFISLLALAVSCYYYLNGNLTLAVGCILIATLQPIINTFSNTSAYLQGNKKYKEAATFQVYRTSIVSAVSILTVLITQDIITLFLAYLTSHLVINTFSHLYHRPISKKENLEEVGGVYFKHAKHTSVRNIMSHVALRIDNIILFTHVGASELAVYFVANLIPEQLKASIKQLFVLILPKYTKHTNLASIRKNIPRRCIQLLFILSIISIAYIIAAPYIFSLILPKYPEAIFFSQLLALSFPPLILILPLGALQSQLKERALYYLNIYGAITSIILSVTLILLFGVLGAVIAKITARYVRLGLAMYYLYSNN